MASDSSARVSPLFRLDGKTVAVCGASAGLGRAIAVAASAIGAKLVLVARREPELLDTLQALAGDGHAHCVADLETAQGRARLAELAGPLDGLVYSAGAMGRLLPFHLLTEAALLDQARSNLVAPLLTLQALLRGKRLQPNASVVTIGSIVSLSSPPASSAHAAAKAGMAAASRSVASELARRHIRLNTVAYGYVDTEAMRRLGVADGVIASVALGLPKPEEVTGAPLFLLCEASRWMTRATLRVDAGAILRQQTVL